MQPLGRILLGFLLAPVAASVFIVAVAGLYSRIEWPGPFLAVLAICYPTAVVLGIPTFWCLKAWKLLQLHHFFSAGLVLGILPSTLLYTVTVEPILALTTLAGAALGGMVFWSIAVRRSNNSLEPTR